MTPGLGINPGHGYTKLVFLSDHSAPLHVILPSLVAHAPRQLVGALKRVELVQVAGGSWWVGEDALISNAPLTALNQDRIRDPAYIPALVRAALAPLAIPDEVLTQAITVSGLPASWSTDRELAQALSHRLRAAAPLGKIKVIAEPLGPVYSKLLNDDGEITGDERLQTGRVAVVDLGHLTVDVAVVRGLVPEPTALATWQLGTARPLQQLQQRLSAETGVDVSLFATDQAVRQGHLMLAGRPEPLPADWARPLADNGRDIATKLVEAWGNGRQYDAILLAGGGASLAPIVEAIQAKFQHAQVVEAGQMAVALGYARLARRIGQAGL